MIKIISCQVLTTNSVNRMIGEKKQISDVIHKNLFSLSHISYLDQLVFRPKKLIKKSLGIQSKHLSTSDCIFAELENLP